MKLLPAFEERMRKTEGREPEAGQKYILPKSPEFFRRKTNFVSNAEQAWSMVELAEQRPISHVGFDTEFQYTRLGEQIGQAPAAQDPTSVKPLLMSISLAEPDEVRAGRLYNFVVDVRNEEVLPALKRLLSLPITFVGHHMKVEMFCLYQLGLPEPRMIWDTFIAEKAFRLGADHYKYPLRSRGDEVEEIPSREAVRREARFKLSLVQTCHLRGVPYAMAGSKDRLQESFLKHRVEEAFSDEQIQYAAEDAIAASRLYPIQIIEAAQTGCLDHLIKIEMPWVKTNAEIEWNGVRIDSTKRERLLRACDLHLEQLEKELKTYGIDNTQSFPRLMDFFERENLLHLFKRHGQYSFDKD